MIVAVLEKNTLRQHGGEETQCSKKIKGKVFFEFLLLEVPGAVPL